MKIAIEGPQLADIDFDGILDILKRKIDVFCCKLVTCYCCSTFAPLLCCTAAVIYYRHNLVVKILEGGKIALGGGGGGLVSNPPRMKPCIYSTLNTCMTP